MATSVFELLDDSVKIEARFLFEDTIDKFLKDDRVNPLPVLFIRDLAGHAALLEGPGIDGTRHQVLCSEDGEGLESPGLCLVSDDFCDMEPRDRRAGRNKVKGLMDGVVGADGKLSPDLCELPG